MDADELLLFGKETRQTGIDFDLYDKVPCKISGPRSEHIPAIGTFESLYAQFQQFIPAALMENIRRCGYQRPTPVQKFSIPAVLVGRELLGSAQTGSGKTVAPSSRF